MHTCSVIYYTIASLGLTGTPVLKVQHRATYPKSEPAHESWPPKVIIAVAYCNAGRSGRFLKWIRSTMNVDWQHSGVRKMLLGWVAQSWHCEMIGKVRKGRELVVLKQSCGWRRLGEQISGWINFSWDSWALRRERESGRCCLPGGKQQSRKRTQLPPVSGVGHSHAMRGGKAGGQASEYLMDKPS